MPERERVRLVLEALPSDVPAGRRLARLLKVLGRHYGWRLVEPVEDVGKQPAPGEDLGRALAELDGGSE